MTKHVSRFLIGMFLIAALSIMLAACGGDSGSSASSSSGGSSASSGGAGTTVMIKESKDSAGKDQYTFDQTTLSVKSGDTVTFQNQSDENQAFTAGDASKAGVNLTVPINQSGTATFKTAGTYKIATDKGATMTVTVQ